ncbi:hypothetical protein ACMC9I_00540 [Deinococcota bacterium DY0809b]
MPTVQLYFRLRVLRTGDGQLRIELETATGERRYFSDFNNLAAFLRRRTSGPTRSAVHRRRG